MVGRGTSDVNFFLNSIDKNPDNFDRVDSGINYTDFPDGDTSSCCFPGFRCLAKNDILTGKVESETGNESDECYSINNLKISISSNIIYGVYDSVLFDPSLDADKKKEYKRIKDSCLAGDFKPVIMYWDKESESFNYKTANNNTTDTFCGVNYSSRMSLDSSGSSLARSGQLPLGLFAENLGSIEDLVLDKHIVKGMETLNENTPIKHSSTASNVIIYTCMVGGFAGNNIGEVKNLTLLDSAVEGTNDNTTLINGRTDVGGIIGRQSFAMSAHKDVELKNLHNEGTVTGYENVGGIVGRAYVHYVNDKDNVDINNASTLYSVYDTAARLGGGYNIASEESNRPRYRFYHDGYVISDTGKSIAGEKIYRAKTITIKDCTNKGRVSGDELIYTPSSVLDNISISGESVAAKSIHCAFIGGIAGITQDGYIYDSNSNSNKESLGNDKYPIYYYYKNGYYDNGFAYVTVENCNSEVLYSKDEIDTFVDETDKTSAVSRDCYVGGLIGYARLTRIKNCNGESTDVEYFGSDKSKYPLVIGRRYVGGLVGCSDETVYNNEGSGYAATNYNLVIGERFVGGVAGGNGIGDKFQETFDFRNPAANEASVPSQIYFDDASRSDRPEGTKNILNKGIALGWNSSELFEQLDRDSSPENDLYISDGYAGSGAIGGVVGATRSPLLNADNIQSNTTKLFALKLVGFSDGTNGRENQIAKISSGELTAETVDQVLKKSHFGGNCVGGVVGRVYGYGYVNKKFSSTTNVSSEVNAVIFGQDFVGGGIGINETTESNSYNIYPYTSNYQNELDGMLVIGRDAVGGLFGACRAKYNQTGDSNRMNDECNSPYSVYGRYAVGGLCGLGNTSQYFNSVPVRLDGTVGKVKVNAIAYAGGYSGVCEDYKNTYFTGEITDISVRAKYFAGGYFGALLNDEALQYVRQNELVFDDIDVSADIFAGSVCGVYYTPSSNYKSFTSVEVDSSKKKKDGTLVSCVDTKCFDSSGYISASVAFNTIVNTDIKDHSIFETDTSNLKPVDMSYNLLNYESHGKIEAELFASGFIGYIPDGSKITISNFTNGSSVNASSYVGGDDVSVYESDNAQDKYAYLGAVVGRVPRNVTIENCNNKVSGSLTETNKDKYYSASNATYLGGLAEVNAGIIKGCTNETEFSYGSGGVGAFAGKNGTTVTKVSYTTNDKQGSRQDWTVNADASNGLIIDCVNKGSVVSMEGFSGGISAANSASKTNDISAAITNCVNLADIGADTGVSSAGMVPYSSGTDIITICRNYGKISGGKRYGIAADAVGYIAKNLEASGLSEYDADDPVAPLESDLARNFYIYDKQAEPEGEGIPDNTTIASPLVNNTGKCYVTMSSETGRPTQELINTFYDRNLGGRNKSTQDAIGSLRNGYVFASDWGELQRKDFNLVYEFKNENGVSRSVFMKYFNVCFYAPYADSFEKILDDGGNTVGYNFKYFYTITFVYDETDDKGNVVERTKTLTRNVSFEPEMNLFNVDSVEAPLGAQIKKIILNAPYQENMNLHDNQTFNFWYYGSYWEDTDGKHYMNSSSKLEDFENPSQDTEFYISTVRVNKDGSYNEYHRYEAGETLDSEKNQSSLIRLYDKKPNDSFDYTYTDYLESSDAVYEKNSCYSEIDAYDSWGMSIDVDVIYPQKGLDADHIRLYLFNRNKLYYEANGWDASISNYLYDVNFYYRDKYGNEKCVTVTRLIPVSSDESQYVYDSVAVPNDQYGNAIRPTKIQVYIPSTKTVENTEGADHYGVAGITWVKNNQEYTFNSKDENPIQIIDSDRIVQKADESSGQVEIAFVYKDSAPLEPTYTNLTKDRWSKQLYSQYITFDGQYRLVYKKNGIVQNEIVISGLEKDPIGFADTVAKREAIYLQGVNPLDSQFVNFVNNYQQYPDKLFVDND